KEFNITVADVLSLRTPKAIAESVKVENFDLDIYSLESGCPLNEPQLNIYLDIVANEKSDSYLIHVNTKISKEFTIGEVYGALDKMFDVHPILGMCVSDEFEVPYLIKGSKPPIFIESDVNDEFLTQSFDLKDSLCRFLIVENNDEYELYSVFHHIIFDALSEKAFKEDLNSLLRGDSVEFDDSFLKVAAFNSIIQDSEDYLSAKKFYESMLADADEAGSLLDCVVSDGPGFMKTTLDLDLKSLKSFLNKCGISENVFFTGVFAYTLSRFVGNNNVLFNIIENGRDRFNNFNSIGMYVNTLPLLIDCKNQEINPFMDYMSNVIYDVMKYNYYPFRLLSNEYGIDSSILFQFIPDWIGDGEEMDESESVYGGMLEDADDLISDFGVDVIQKGKEYWLNIVYSDKYSKDMVNRFIESYELILHEILTADQLSDINYISQSDLEFLNNVNQTESSLAYGDVLDAFNCNLSKYPNNKLVSMNDVNYSYAEGAFIADKIAKKLIGLGVKPNDFISFLTERSEYYMFSILAILSVGGAYVPLDDAHPDERIEFILKDTQSKVIIVSDETYERAKELTGEDIAILNISDILGDEIESLNSLHVVYGDLACVLYTSGTTGIPKGVKITRKSILNLSEFYIKRYDLSNDDVYGLFASIGFDVAMKAVFPSITAGACLNIIPNEIKLNMKALNEYFIKYNVTHTEISTQVSKLFISQTDNTSLKVLTTGGEKLGNLGIDVDYRFVDSYGPTEACVDVTSIDVENKIDYSSVGYLLDNVKSYILDDEFRRVPVGAVGELYLAGCQISDGYLNRDEETNKSFLTNPFSDDEDYSVMYRTGDVVRQLPDGSLGIVGRRDGQVKVRGNRVELSEVESVIHEMDYVEDVTVQTVKNHDNNELVAYVVISKDLDNQTLKSDISNFVIKYKPEYMVPSFVMELDEIPLTVNGKVDKRALPEVDLDSLHAQYVAATNETEKIIMESFEEVFDLENVSLIDNFVNLGGDSISAIRLIALLEKHNISCTARDILVYKTPYLISQHVDTKESVDYDVVEGEVDLLPIQSYFFDQININRYSHSFIVKSEFNLDINMLQEAFDILTNYHDMLRVIYRFDGDDVIQEVLPVNTRVCDIKEHYIEDNFEETMKKLFLDSLGSINMENKMMDIHLIHYCDETYVSFVLHHLIVDGVSWNILLMDLSYIYYKLYFGEEIKLSRPYPYKYWVEDVKKLVYNISDEEKQHWIEINNLLDDSQIKGAGNIFAINMEINYDIDNLLMLSEEEYLALAISRAYKKTYGKDIIFSRESHGRDDTIANLNRTIGWFTSEYPVPVEVCNGNDNVSLMRDVYSIKNSFNNVNNLGLNYGSLIYITNELEFKHCPVTFNFLSKEFVFKNKLFESVNQYLLAGNKIDTDRFEHESYGITFNILRLGDYYFIDGNYANNTYIGDEFDAFIENIRYELEFIADYEFDDGIVCCLSEPQMGIYLDEKVNEKENAYLTSGIIKCGKNTSIDEIKGAINKLINKHPLLKSRILDTGDMPLLICDSDPLIKVSDTDDYSKLIRPFDLDKSLARFFIINNEEGNSIYYNIHHLISDAITCGIIEDDLAHALNDDLDDNIDLAFIRASYDSFESKFGPEYESAHEFFKDMFSDIDDVQYLLEDVNGFMGKISLPVRGIRNRVEIFAQNLGITVSNFLNAVFAYTYSRFTGSDKVNYNFTEHGRHEDYSQDAVGMFVRTIPLIVDCKNNSINDFISDVSDLILESMSNSIFPFRLVASEFGLKNNVGFEYNYDLNDVSDIGDEIVFSDKADTVTEFLCVVNDLDDGYVVSVNHSDKFRQDTVLRFLNVFKEILVQFLDKKELRDINYISNEDIEILDSYNSTTYPLEYEDVLDAFNDNLSKYSDKNIISMEDRVYSYAEGAFMADKIAKKLIELGTKPNDFVSFLTERSEYYLFSILGIMSAGGVYVPLDDAHPDERIEFILKDTQSKVIIVSDETYERAKNLISEDTILLNISDIFKEDIGSLSSLPVIFNDLACILYTSGTTGVPKGVKIRRKAIVNYVDNYVNYSNMGSNDVFALYASIGFDVAAIKSILAPLYCGASLTIVPDEIKLNMAKLNEYFINNNVTHANLTTQVAKLFIDNVDNNLLKILVAGGEKLGKISKNPNYRFVDAYGPTEACVSVTCIDNEDKIDSSSVGHLLNNLKAYILDNNLNRVPFGAVGELYLAGYQIAEGYLNREEETRNAFLTNPFTNDENYGVMYRTGDMARLLPDGSIAIIGRRDGQVKIRGNRVELSEIEMTIREINYVEDVTVQTVKHGSNNEIVAYVVVNKELDDDGIKDSICSYVAEQKADYMIPSFVIKIDEIPLTVNGKVDKRALPEVDVDSLRREYVAPTNEDEELIVEAFEKVFDQDKIGIQDDFIRLGGDSLTAIKLLTYLEDYNITAADILSLHTPYAIAKNIKNVSFDLDTYSLESGCPLTEPQLNVYLDIVANDKVDSYLIPLFTEISKDYDINTITEALDEMLNVHPILGMCVSDEFDVPYLVKGVEPPIIVKSGIGEDYIKEFLTKPFDLYNNLSRFLIVENNENYKLYAVFHHIIFDALSGDVFKQDLHDIMDGKSINVDDSFLKTAAFSQQIQNTDEFNEAYKFYDAMLVDSEDCGVLLDEVIHNQSGIHTTELDLDLDSFKTFLHNHGISENILFTSAFAYTLSRFVGGDKVKFNIVENGRDRFNNMDSIGMYVNTLPVQVNCENQNVSEFIKYSSNLIYGVMKYNYYPFRLLATEYDIDSSILFQFMPDWFNNASGNEKKDSLLQSVLNDLEDLDDFISDFTFEVIQKGNGYYLSVLYSDKYSKEMIERFTKSYKLILSQIIEVDNLSDINYVLESDLEILDTYNQTDHSLKYDDILDAFNINLSRYPDNKLVSMDEDNYSYGEGAFIADKISKCLKDLNVNVQDCVSFLVPRNEYYMFSVLGILSAGGVYVPLDDKLPDDRIKFILKDTDSKVVIVTNETYERVNNLSDDVSLLNISNIFKEEIGSLSHLPVNYGDLACILYTSGTTGIPKGVKITRKSVLNLSAFYQDKYGLSNDDVYGLFSTIGFDAAVLAIFTVLYSGACLSVVPDDVRLDMNALNDYFIKQNVNHTLITSQVGKLFMKDIEKTSLDVLLVGGEKLGEFESPEDYLLVDAFGPTEACVFISSIKNSDKIDSSSVGHLDYNTKAYVLDDELRRVPIGAVGELYVAGYPVSDGYLNREEENKNAFLDNPFDNDEKYRTIYRTGDMVRLLPDGSLAIVSRRDSQVKIRGNRVELTEIDSVIRQIDSVRDVTVQTIKNGTNNELVAYVVPFDEIGDVSINNIVSKYVSEHKPDYMVPSYVVELDSIPLNVNGKVDKRALPEVDVDSLHAEYVAPSTETEKIVVKSFENVFNQDKIGIYDDFVRLGGDSLTAIKLISYLKEFNISVADILKLRTPKDISQNIEKVNVNLDLYSLESGCPLNEAQLNVYLDIISRNADPYTIFLDIDIPNEYSSDELVDALNVMFEVHPILRMKLSKEFEIPYLVKGNMPLISYESNMDEDIIQEFKNKSFDLEDSLCRFLIVENGDAYKLYGVFHHLIFDAISNLVFNQDLIDILKGKSIAVDDSFLKVSAFNSQIQKMKDYDDAKIFYDMMLCDSEDAGVLLDDVSSSNPGIYNVDLNIDVREFIEKYDVSENVLFTSIFAYALSRFVGDDTVIFNIIENGRSRFNNFNSIGMYVNTLPISVDCGNKDIASFMEYMSNLVYSVMKYNYYPFRLLAKEYDIDSNILFQFMPEWVGDDGVKMDEEGSAYYYELEDGKDMIADLSVGIIQKGDKYRCSISYSNKFSKNMIERFAECYKSILHEIMDADRLDEIKYISQSDLEILNDINKTEHSLSYDDVLDAFNDCLSKYPNNKIVSMYDVSYSYAEGAFIADKIAKRLIDLGVESQDNVAFLVDRSELYLFSILSILSIGAVYVPVDDKYPDERVKFILDDVKTNVVLVSDETSGRVDNLAEDVTLLNISDIVKEDIGNLSHLPVNYGDLACILYTSGTTGVPKGVKIRRKAIVNYVDNYVNYSNMGSNDVFALYASIGFDVAAIKSILAPLYCGAS
ncbi:MAG: amino acid adenylation domain-containing protein, partial [Methanobrevibacter sp.]|nr:amino acid adenylation domain-containing protein [Methanobrevibacter sp.]